MGKICFGVDLGGTTVKMGIFTVDGAMLEEWEIPTRKDDGGKYILSDIADSINDSITKLFDVFLHVSNASCILIPFFKFNSKP